jgi:hypothetical protein
LVWTQVRQQDEREGLNARTKAPDCIGMKLRCISGALWKGKDK